MTIAAVVLILILVPASASTQMATAERLESSGWWPTKRTAVRQDYVGARDCAACHRTQAALQQRTSMARTGDRARDSTILTARPALTFRSGQHSYTIERRGDNSVYVVSDGNRSLSAALAWAFGAGKVGQSFLFEREGMVYESRVSYYESIGRLDFTPNRSAKDATTLEEAMARPVGTAELVRCFGCHTTTSGTGSAQVDFAGVIPGVTCEACHGPGREHVDAMRKPPRDRAGRAIMDLGSLSAADSVDFCGSCHATFWDVELAGERGIAALRSQPFRLQSSRCWQQGDSRLACVACHDPHTPLVRDTLSYDVRCLACHGTSHRASGSAAQRQCPVAERNCVSCHMPKYEVPDMHFKFTDHLIRIVKTGN